MTPAQFIMKGLIKGYQWVISPILPGTCRFVPTCSEYAADAVTRHGAAKGGWLALRRILRCHPWGGWGYDPVPAPDDDGTDHPPACRCGHGPGR
jgi:putative membrane protein insertion efficiency factor